MVALRMPSATYVHGKSVSLHGCRLRGHYPLGSVIDRSTLQALHCCAQGAPTSAPQGLPLHALRCKPCIAARRARPPAPHRVSL